MSQCLVLMTLKVWNRGPHVWSPHSPAPHSSPETFVLQFADNAFAGVTVLKTAHVENNRLTQLPRNFPFDKMETLTISRNPWHCSCQLAPLRKYGTAIPRAPRGLLGPPSCARTLLSHSAALSPPCSLTSVVCLFFKFLSSFLPVSQVAERQPHPC